MNNEGTFWRNVPANLGVPRDAVERRLLMEYGAVFVARGGVVVPEKIIFNDEAEVAQFQSVIPTLRETIGEFSIELQAPAMAALAAAMGAVESDDRTISPRGSDSARRSYDETIGLWASRVVPALIHWVGKGMLTPAEADRINALSPFEQVPEVLKLEENGIFFAKDLSKSIVYSVAPPGTSQHLSMLALDIKEHENQAVRALLAEHGWYQTVVSDLPHFTFIGVPEEELSALGLKRINDGERSFWVPDIQ